MYDHSIHYHRADKGNWTAQHMFHNLIFKWINPGVEMIFQGKVRVQMDLNGTTMNPGFILIDAVNLIIKQIDRLYNTHS